MAKQQQLKEVQRERDLARDCATTKFREKCVIDEMLAQAKQWNQVSELRRYADAIRSWASQVDHERRAQVIDWDEQIEKQPDATDPLQDPGPVEATGPDQSDGGDSPF